MQTPPHNTFNSAADSASYLFAGARLLLQPGLKRFVLVPLAINLVVFAIVTSWLISYFVGIADSFDGWLPSWLSWMSGWVLGIFTWLFGSVFLVSILLIYGYSFNILTNIIAAPFNGILSEKIEQRIAGTQPDDETLGEMIPRTISREITKLIYFIPRSIAVALAMFITSFIPGVNFIGIALGLLWGAWSMAVQYADYPADNHQIEFKGFRQTLKKNRINSLSFGGLTMAAFMVPVLNIFVMPAAVAGGTLFWIAHRDQLPEDAKKKRKTGMPQKSNGTTSSQATSNKAASKDAEFGQTAPVKPTPQDTTNNPRLDAQPKAQQKPAQIDHKPEDDKPD